MIGGTNDGKEQARWIYKTMNEIRYFEEKVHKIFSDGKIPGFVHLYVGEAVATGVMSQLEDDDYITSTHRGHGHAIAKGCDLNGMMAEIMGKRDGLGHGKGGSMHVAEIDKGMLGANGIVSGGFGLATGAGISIRNQGKKNVAVCFFGDGAANEGNFHEGLNFASILNLPVIFVCENNNSVKVQHMIMPVLQKQLQSVLQLITCQVSEWMAWMSLKFIKQRKKL